MSNILIIKHGSLGDIVQISGVLKDIRESHNDKKIFILTTLPYVDVLSRCPYLDGVLLDRRLPRWNIYYLLKLKKMLVKYNFSHVYDLQNSSRTSFYRKYLLRSSNWSSTETTLKKGEKKKDFDNESVLERFKIQLNKAMFKRQILISYPIALQETLVMFSFTIFYKIMGILGAVQLAATHIIFKIMHASFMPAIGIGQACATLVGKFLGEENPDKAERAINESLRGSLMVMGTVGLCFILFAEVIIPLFITDSNVIKLAVPGLRFVGLLQFADAVCFTTWFALTGAGDTKVPAIVDVLTHWILFIPACYLLGITLGFGFWGPWIAFGLHLTFFAAFVFWRFRMGYWKTIKV